MTILKLLVSGNKDDEYMAKALCLNTELVAFVVDELERLQLIDSRRRVTESGLKLLHEDTDTYDIRTGYIYYNYVTKTFMDAFVPDEKRTEVETGDRRGGKISFDLGTAADRNWCKGIVVNADTSATIKPTPYDIIAVCKRHNRRTRNLGFIVEEQGEMKSASDAQNSGGISDKADLPWEIQSAKVLGSQTDVYVVTYMFMAADDVINRSRLQVCYPFGEGTSSSLSESVEKLSQEPENTAVKDEILGLKSDVFAMSDEELDNVRKGHSKAEKAVKKVLSDKIDDYPTVRDALILVESSYFLVKGLSDSNKGSNVKIIKKNLGDYIVNNYNLLASIFIETAVKYDYFTDAVLTEHDSQNAEILGKLAEKVGFDQIDDKFFKIKKRAIKEAAKASQHKLNAIFAYNLIAAERFPAHPFYKLAKAVPDLIVYLAQLTELRNASSHAGEIYQELEMVSAYRRKNMYIAYLLLDGLTFADECEDDEESGNGRSEEENVKAMREAEIICDSVYVSYFSRNSNIAAQLRNLQFEILINGEYYPKRASEVLEAIFKYALSKRLVENALSSVRDSANPEERDELLAEMRSLGFNADKILYYQKDKVMRTFKNYTMGTITTLFYVWYYSEMNRADNMLKDLSSKCPDFIRLVIDVQDNRGHSGKMHFKDEKLGFTKKNLDNAVNAFLEILFERGELQS
jgi:hypothetical protein